MNLTPGVRLGPYEIVAPIGAGGMGEVYRARDTRLDRTVAIKILPAALAQNPQLRVRFEREAKAISALAHPHICTLHDVGSHDGIEFLVMEHLEGESLADRLGRGPIPLDETLRYGIEIADALDKAHRRGIVHRDLKPGNIMITRSGAKLLDFGLARTIETAAPDPDGATAVAAPDHKPLTEEGTIVGTMQYMAPEQLDSRPADARTDIFAFGTVLYEMLTGRRAFNGKTRSSLIASIVAAEPPPVSALQPLAPASLERVIRICLEKDPDDRWQSAHDLKLELQGLATAQPVASGPGKRGLAGWIAAALIAAAAVTWFVVDRNLHHRPRRSVRFEIAPPEKARFHTADGPVLVSPDGRRIVVRLSVGQERDILCLRNLDGTRLEKLRGTEGAYDVFWSDDGQQIGFFQNGKLKRLDLASSAIATVAQARDTRGGTWAGGTILFTPSPLGPIMQISANGGTPRPVTKLDPARKETGHWRPSFLPDKKRFLFLARSADEDLSGVYLGSLDSSETRRLLDVATTAIYAEPGYLLYVNESTLYAQPFDAAEAKTTGPASVVAVDVEYSQQYGSPGYSAGGGVLAWHVRGLTPRTPVMRINWDGKESELGIDGSNLHISRDGSRLAVSHVEQQRGNQDIWTHDLRRGLSSRLTYDPADETGPVWSPDGKQIAYVASTTEGLSVRISPAAGSGAAKTVLLYPLWLEIVDWSVDGRTLLAEVESEVDRLNLGTIDLTTGKITLMIATPFEESSARFSPDGKWVSYESDESGRAEISIQPFPPDGTRVQVSTGGGHSARWNARGDALYYLLPDNVLVSVPLTFGATGIEVGKPTGTIKVGTIDYVILPDGTGVLAARNQSTEGQPIVVVTNWSGPR